MPRATKKRVVKKKKNMRGRKRGGASVPCPVCNADSRVILTRRTDHKVSRHRTCAGPAAHDFSTIERVAS